MDYNEYLCENIDKLKEDFINMLFKTEFERFCRVSYEIEMEDREE